MKRFGQKAALYLTKRASPCLGPGPGRTTSAWSTMLDDLFAQAFCEVNALAWDCATFHRVISSWEREHVMLLV